MLIKYSRSLTMNRKLFLLLLILSPYLTISVFAQETSIQFPRLDFHMKMNQDLKPSVSYNAEANIVVGDKSGLIFSLGVNGDDLNLQSSAGDLVKLDTLRMSISPSAYFNLHTFYGRYKYLGEDKVIPRGFQFNYTPGTDYYGYKTLEGAGLAFTFPIEEGRYEPELVLYSNSKDGIEYLNIDFLTTFRFELWSMELYAGLAIPTLTAIEASIKGHAGLSVYTTLDYANVYFSLYIPSHFGDEFTFDDVYFRLSQYLLINGFEQTFSIYSLGSESGDVIDPVVGFNGIPDINMFLSIGGRINNIGFGMDYGLIVGEFLTTSLSNDAIAINHRIGAYADLIFLGLTYKLGVFYTLPNSFVYITDSTGPGEVGFYVSVFGRS